MGVGAAEKSRVSDNNDNNNKKKMMKKVYFLHGGPAPSFLSPAVADYSIQGVRATVSDVPDVHMQHMYAALS